MAARHPHVPPAAFAVPEEPVVAQESVVDLAAMVGLARCCRPGPEPVEEPSVLVDDANLTELAARLTVLLK